VVSVSDSWSRGCGFNSRPLHYQVATLGKLFTPMCLCHHAVQFGTGQGRWCSEAGKITVGLGSHWPCGTDFSGLSTYGLNGLREGDEHPTYAPNWSMVHFILSLKKWHQLSWEGKFIVDHPPIQIMGPCPLAPFWVPMTAATPLQN